LTGVSPTDSDHGQGCYFGFLGNLEVLLLSILQVSLESTQRLLPLAAVT